MPPGGNVFTWVLIGFPLYLLIKGRLTTYLALATGSAATTGTTSSTGQVVAP